MRHMLYGILTVWGLLPILIVELHAQETPAPPQEVTIERVAVTLRDSAAYQFPLALSAQRSMTVRAATSGTIKDVTVKPGDKVVPQGELARLDSQISQLRFQTAKAEFQIALREEPGTSAQTQEIHRQRESIARNNLEIAQIELDQAIIRAPYAADVHRVYVEVGEFVLPGTPLMDIADPSLLVVEVPVDRTEVKAGDNFELELEDRRVNGKVEAVLPPAEAMVKLRDLVLSLASARIVVDNSKGQLAPGQSVISPLIPRHPVLETPNSALVNTSAGQRKVQVIRDGFVRDIPVSLLGAAGETHSYVSGRFATGDELIVRSSISLVDGTWVRPKLEILQQQSAKPPSAPVPARGSGVGL